MKSWFDERGKDTDVVVSTRVRLARNLDGAAFPPRWSDEKAKEITEKVKSASGGGFEYLNLDNAPDINKQSLVEEHIISREMLGGKNKSLLISENDGASIMIGEEDHIRLQVICAGFDIDASYKKASELDDMLAKKLDYAYDSQFGYLTHCPTNVGTGLRVSVMLHLPALKMTGRINQIIGEVGKFGLTIRGLYGEGSESKGDLYQLSNQITLGISEEQTCGKLKNIAMQVIESERELRKKIAKANGAELEDSLWRALGTLAYARKLSSSECENLLSKVKLGINLGIIDTLDDKAVISLMINSEPAHISLEAGAPLSANERDRARADRIRKEIDGYRKGV